MSGAGEGENERPDGGDFTAPLRIGGAVVNYYAPHKRRWFSNGMDQASADGARHAPSDADEARHAK